MKVPRFLRALTSGLLAATLLCAGATAQAQQKVRFAYIKAETLMPFFLANSKGYFKAEGIELEMIEVPGGPAVVAAMAGGSADIGYAAITPVAIARDQGQLYKFFIGMESEQHPNKLWGTILASERSGIQTLADIKGKKMLVAAPGGLCELASREWLAKAGVKWSDITLLRNPPPQMQSALELGNADAACIFEPFTTSVMSSKVKPKVLARGYLSDAITKPYTVDGVFASDAWIAQNGKLIDSIKRVVMKAWAELVKDPALMAKTTMEEFRFSAELAAKVKIGPTPTVSIDAALVEPIVEALKRHAMVKPGMRTADIVHGAN